MEQDVQKRITELQATLNGITQNGFWHVVVDARDNRITFMPHTLEVLGALPVLRSNGQVDRWRYAVLMIDRGFAEVGASMHENHLHIIESIEWVKAPDGRIYGAYLKEKPGGYTLCINEIDAGEDPDEATAWRDYLARLAAIPERVAECRASIREEFSQMAEGALRG